MEVIILTKNLFWILDNAIPCLYFFINFYMKKPVIGYIAGLTAPKGRVMGHAGAIVSAYGESAIEKVEILKECGVIISKNPSVMGDTVKSVLDKM